MKNGEIETPQEALGFLLSFANGAASSDAMWKQIEHCRQLLGPLVYPPRVLFPVGSIVRCKDETLTAVVTQVCGDARRVQWEDDGAFGVVLPEEIELAPGRPAPARNEASGETTKNT